MTIEDEGLEPELDLEEKPTKKKAKNEASVVVEKTEKPVKKGKKSKKELDAPEEVPEPVKKGKKSKKTAKKELEAPKEVSEPTTQSADDSVSLETPAKKTKKKKKAKPAEAQEPNGAEDQKEGEKTTEAVVTKKQKKNKKRKTEEEPAGPGPSKRQKKDQERSERPDKKYAAVLEKVKDINMPFKVREILAKEVEVGCIEAAEVPTVFSQWRRMRKYMASEERMAKLVEMDGTIDDVRNVANMLVNKRLLYPHQVGEIIYKWRNRERRRVNRQEQKLANKFCYHCRKSGHYLSDCPEKESEDPAAFASGICFKCGSGEHSIGTCPRKHVKGFPFATCFVCNEQGHLSRDCKNNINGIYPDGGCCNVCGSQKHLKRDCPELDAQKKGETEKKVVARTMTAMSRADDDYDALAPEPEQTKEKKKTTKVVKF